MPGRSCDNDRLRQSYVSPWVVITLKTAEFQVDTVYETKPGAGEHNMWSSSLDLREAISSE